MVDLKRLNDVAMTAAKKLGVDDAVTLAATESERMLRFANNSATVIKSIEETNLVVYLAKDKRRAIAATSNPDEKSVRRFVSELHASIKRLPQEDYGALPEKATRFGSTSSIDRKIEDSGERLPELAGAAISGALKAGGRRCAGVITASNSSVAILTTNGTSGLDSGNSITLNIRAFSENDASGHGLSCSATMSGFEPEEAGARAGADARSMVEASLPEPGKYSVLMSPTVASNLIGTIAGAASAFSVEAGQSYLAEKVGKRVAAKGFDLTDHGTMKGALGGRAFDDEGTPTGTTKIIEGGVLKGYLHNLTTAKRWKARTTGNAGLIDPGAWNIEVGAGDASFDEMVKSMKRGIILTSNWYTRFKNHREGEFSTVPRDGAYLVENGRVTKPLKGMRAGDTQERMFTEVPLLSKERSWIKWWEVGTPTLCPWVLSEGVTITRAYE